MKEIKRDVYLNKIIEKRENGLIKIITGIRKIIYLKVELRKTI